METDVVRERGKISFIEVVLFCHGVLYSNFLRDVSKYLRELKGATSQTTPIFIT
jgi:hypothetical protein